MESTLEGREICLYQKYDWPLQKQLFYITQTPNSNTLSYCYFLSTKGHYFNGELSIQESHSKPPDRETTRKINQRREEGTLAI